MRTHSGCLHCGAPIAFLAKLTAGMFCCDEHREAYRHKLNDIILKRLQAEKRRLVRRGSVTPKAPATLLRLPYWIWAIAPREAGPDALPMMPGFQVPRQAPQVHTQIRSAAFLLGRGTECRPGMRKIAPEPRYLQQQWPSAPRLMAEPAFRTAAHSALTVLAAVPPVRANLIEVASLDFISAFACLEVDVIARGSWNPAGFRPVGVRVSPPAAAEIPLVWMPAAPTPLVPKFAASIIAIRESLGSAPRTAVSAVRAIAPRGMEMATATVGFAAAPAIPSVRTQALTSLAASSFSNRPQRPIAPADQKADPIGFVPRIASPEAAFAPAALTASASVPFTLLAACSQGAQVAIATDAETFSGRPQFPQSTAQALTGIPAHSELARETQRARIAAPAGFENVQPIGTPEPFGRSIAAPAATIANVAIAEMAGAGTLVPLQVGARDIAHSFVQESAPVPATTVAVIAPTLAASGYRNNPRLLVLRAPAIAKSDRSHAIALSFLAMRLRPMMPVHRATLAGSVGQSKPAIPESIVSNAKFWTKIPASWKRVSVGLPVAAVLMATYLATEQHSNVSQVHAESSLLQNVVGDVRRDLKGRAAVNLDETFESGPSPWTGAENWEKNWKLGQGEAYPGSLALYSASMNLKDYTAEFSGQIVKKGMGFAVRARDLENYYAVRFVVTRAGTIPEVFVERYAVIAGEAKEPIRTRVHLTLASDAVYHVHLEAKDQNFSLYVNGSIIDNWSDERFPAGGVGFFTKKGEKARITSLHVWHQDDTVGRILAHF